MKKLCVYCGLHQGKAWDKTGENVCLPCRFDFLVQEFQSDGLLTTKQEKIDVEVAKDMLKPL